MIQLGYEQHIPNYQTRSTLHKENNFKNFAEYIIDINKEVIRGKLGYQFDDIKITDMWANVLKPGGITQYTHSNNFFQWCIFIQMQRTLLVFVFLNSKVQANVIVFLHLKMNLDNANVLEYKSKTDQIYLFPSWIYHWEIH